MKKSELKNAVVALASKARKHQHTSYYRALYQIRDYINKEIYAQKTPDPDQGPQ